MHELIVLGLIPGTTLQITFLLWLFAVVALAATALVWLGHRTHIFRDWLITLSLLRMTRKATYPRLTA
jgi:hypothetical protein